MTACRRGSQFDATDTESESDGETAVTQRDADDDLRRAKGTGGMEVQVSVEMPELEDTFEMPKTPSKGKQAKRIPLTVTTPRTKTLERSKSSSSVQQKVEEVCPPSPDSSTSTIVFAETIERPTGPGMWRHSYGADSLASEQGDSSMDTEPSSQVMRISVAEKKTPPAIASGCSEAMEETTESASSSSSEVIETPTTPKLAHTISVSQPERTLPRHWGSKRHEAQNPMGGHDDYGSLDRASANRQEVMFAMGIDHSRTSSRDLQTGSARAAHGTRLHRKSLRNIFGTTEQRGEVQNATVIEELGQRVPSMKRSMPSLRSAAPVNLAKEHTETPLAKKFSFASLSRAFRWSAKSTTTPTTFQRQHMPSVTPGVTQSRELASPHVTPPETAHAHGDATACNSIPTITVVKDNENK